MTELWWSACVGCALWGVLITAVCFLLTAAVCRAWRAEKKMPTVWRDRREQGRHE